MKRLFDLAVKFGEYTNRDGETKSRYANVGVLMEGNNGKFILLDKHFNPAGVEGRDGKIVISMFEPRDEGKKQDNRQSAGGQARRESRDLDDSDIPF